MKRKLPLIIAHSGVNYHNSHRQSPQYQQLELFDSESLRKPRPEISCVNGTTPHQENRYQVTVGNRVLGKYLTADEALKLASNQGGKR